MTEQKEAVERCNVDMGVGCRCDLDPNHSGQHQAYLESVDEVLFIGGVSASTPKEADPRLIALVEQWRADTDAEDARLKQHCYGGALDGDMLDDDIERQFSKNAERRRCADELEAVLSALQREQE